MRKTVIGSHIFFLIGYCIGMIIASLILYICLYIEQNLVASLLILLIILYYMGKVFFFCIDLCIGSQKKSMYYKKVKGCEGLWSVLAADDRLLYRTVESFKDYEWVKVSICFVEKENKKIVILKMVATADEIKKYVRKKGAVEVEYYKYSHIIKRIG